MPSKDPEINRRARATYRSNHPDRVASTAANWHQQNRDSERARVAQWRIDNPEGAFNLNLRTKYGLTREQYDQMVIDQGGVCAICEGPPCGMQRGGPRTRLEVDHDHVTGKVRGLLCHPCNLMLGHARDRVDTLQRATVYLTAGVS